MNRKFYGAFSAVVWFSPNAFAMSEIDFKAIGGWLAFWLGIVPISVLCLSLIAAWIAPKGNKLVASLIGFFVISFFSVSMLAGGLSENRSWIGYASFATCWVVFYVVIFVIRRNAYQSEQKRKNLTLAEILKHKDGVDSAK